MNEIEFKIWLSQKEINRKVQSDYISRLKRIERELNHCDIDEQYRNDNCEYLMSLFVNRGDNDAMKHYQNVNLPIGKNYMNTYRHALKQYIQFCMETAIVMNQ